MKTKITHLLLFVLAMPFMVMASDNYPKGKYTKEKRIKKEYKDKKKPIVLITGCVAQAEGEVILKKSKYVDAVIGPQSYQKINEIIKKIENNNKEKIDETNFDVIKKFDTLSIGSLPTATMLS